MDNYGYSSNDNEVHQEALNNLQPNESKQEQQQTKGIYLVGLLTGIIISSLIASGIYVGIRVADIFRTGKVRETSAHGTAAESVVNDDSISKLESIEKIIEEYYYNEEEINANNMIEGMYSGMVASLGDRYSVYYTEEEWEKLMHDTEGIYYGIGAYVSRDEITGCGKINRVLDNTPAQEAGLRENDIIYRVDGESVRGLELSEMVSKMKGEEGTTVRLTIYREGEDDYLEIDVVRRRIESVTVNYEMLDDQIGYIRIMEFDEVTYKQFVEALDAVKAQAAKGLILDLRSNPGGGLTVVVDIARQILPEGLIVYTEDRSGKRTEYSCDGDNELQMPLVVLVNGSSASASEILAGAIKDYGKGTLIGTTTFGKGIVQRILPLTDGSALKLTVSAYYTPNGNNIHNIGIEPDIECELDVDAYYDNNIDSQLERAKEEIGKMMAK